LILAFKFGARALLVILTLWAGAAHALPDQSALLALAQRALADHDFDLAFASFSRLASTSPLAQFSLGLMEQQGLGRVADPVAACRWYGQAAQNRIPAAAQLYADCQARGIGQPVDGAGATHWYLAAAQAGISVALCQAGELYLRGEIVSQDVSQGIAYCTQAAQAESPVAMLRLAELYRQGRQTPPDLRLARYWYEQAAQRHVPVAQFQLGLMLSAGEGGKADLQNARFWLEQAAQEGYSPAYLALAILYANVPVDPQTGALPAADLARVYMWSRAAYASTGNPAQLAEIARIQTLIDQVMPAAWKPALDERVARHLAHFPAAPAQ